MTGPRTQAGDGGASTGGVVHRAIYPGSFDPITLGHLDVIARARHLFDELIVAVGFNPSKEVLFSASERVEMTRALVAEMVEKEPAGAPVRVESFAGLTVDFATRARASVLIKGIRNLSDVQYEVQQALTNREVAGLESVFIVSGASFAYTSSSLIKQITALGNDLGKLDSMVPALVIEALRSKKVERHPLLDALVRANSDT